MTSVSFFPCLLLPPPAGCRRRRAEVWRARVSRRVLRDAHARVNRQDPSHRHGTPRSEPQNALWPTNEILQSWTPRRSLPPGREQCAGGPVGCYSNSSSSFLSDCRGSSGQRAFTRLFLKLYLSGDKSFQIKWSRAWKLNVIYSR